MVVFDMEVGDSEEAFEAFLTCGRADEAGSVRDVWDQRLGGGTERPQMRLTCFPFS